MNAIIPSDTQAGLELTTRLEAQRAAFLAEGHVSAEVRINRINRAIAQLQKYQDQIADALNSDFGHRSTQHSKLMDVAAGIGPLVHARKHLKKWMRAEKRSTLFPLNLFGARSRIEFQPLGVVGIISPWNFPVNLTFAPLAQVLAAGNRAMIKPSEFTPATSELLKRMVEEVFDPSEISVITGGPEIGQTFSSLAFDHLIFTGATSIAKHVMTAAAQNLVPVTLELGGKSPVVVGESADINLVCNRVMWGKTTNAGQICLAPDYCFVPERALNQYIEGLKASTVKMFPSLLSNSDYTSVINQRHFDRLTNYLADAKAKGATIIELNPAHETFEGQPHHKIPPMLLLDCTDDMLVMQEEIFGPLMPIKTYRNIDEVISYVNSKPRPLGLYYFGDDKQEERALLDRTTSGGVTINDVIMHVSQEDLPFGGVGPSGMGAYHGFEGFKTFSHTKSIFSQSKMDINGMTGMNPPFNEKTDKTIKQMLKG
ncbi:coniferyl aldehyde dehydrogenase [Microbulbifer agarilyticus]|uniref:Aldehyde dehydrogenase n=1 Tax=Microbulbifer agarilyticus TaxID=260552 RepID=A0A1Q2M606_9GAMM|nr:coniferyl aldehyde dehydrogenase [Microbulbifer agarilyticus]AQQ68154.1 coniferyl aldehyde dehydrogenase [Microbulbifer agarilyticus]